MSTKVEKQTKKKDKVDKNNKSTKDKSTKPSDKPMYIMCPRCEINYIISSDEYCTVCKADMGLVDRSILLPDPEEIGEEKLCPNCNVTYLAEDEEICFLCAKEQGGKFVARATEVEAWDKDIEEPDVSEDLDDISLTDLEEKEALDDEDLDLSEDDFDYIDPEEIDDMDDYVGDDEDDEYYNDDDEDDDDDI